MIISLSHDELKLILDVLDREINELLYEDASDEILIPYRKLYSRLTYELNKFERG